MPVEILGILFPGLNEGRNCKTSLGILIQVIPMNRGNKSENSNDKLNLGV